MSARAWEEALDAFAASLAAVEAALDAEDWDALEAADWTPPDIDAPMDALLLPVAEALAARAAVCERRVRAAMVGRSDELSGISTRRRAAAQYSAPGSGATRTGS